MSSVRRARARLACRPKTGAILLRDLPVARLNKVALSRRSRDSNNRNALGESLLCRGKISRPIFRRFSRRSSSRVFASKPEFPESYSASVYLLALVFTCACLRTRVFARVDSDGEEWDRKHPSFLRHPFDGIERGVPRTCERRNAGVLVRSD